MRIAILGGGGTIGKVMAGELARRGVGVILADRDPEAAQAAADSAGDGVAPLQLDVTDVGALVGTLKQADACINSVNYYFNIDVMRACLEAGVPYLDLGGLFHVTRKQLELHQVFVEKGLTAVLGLGSCPGVANVQAGWLGEMLEQVDYVRIYNGSTQDEGESLAAPYAIQTILDEISKPAMVFRDGEFVTCPPLGEEEFYLFPEPIGWAKTHLSLHSEVATIPLSLAAKGIQECFFKITFFGFAEAALRKLQFLAELGLASDEPVDVDGVKVSPRSLLLSLLRSLPEAKEKPISKGFKDVATEVRGSIDGRPVLLRADTFGGPEPGSGVSGGTRLVAAPPAIVACWMAEGHLDRPGVWAPEQAIEPKPFFDELADRGFTTRLTRSDVTSSA